MKKTITRLNRIIGQLNWLKKMIDQKEDCWKVIIQFQAAKSALDNAFSEILNDNLARCLENKKHDELKKTIQLLIKSK